MGPCVRRDDDDRASSMTTSLASRIALVTGASRGIGYAVARALARAGAHVVAVARTQGGLEELDDEIGNAGVAGPSSPLGHIELKPWEEVMAVNVTANFQLVRCMEPLLKKSDAGRAVFVTSGAANQATAYVGPYAASKAALETLVRVWAHETASTKVRVNLFNPGPIRTRMRATVFPGEDPETLDTPEQAAEFIVPMCAPDWNETGKFYDYKTRTLMSFRSPA